MATARKTAVAIAATPRKRAVLEPVPRGRVRLDVEDTEEGIGQASTYFADPQKEGIQFVRAGCAVFDAMCGGGYPLGRIVNIVGDKSAGKTLLTMEAFANFVREFDGLKRYGESEHAYDKAYAEALGIPEVELAAEERDAKGNPIPFRTVEDFATDLSQFCDRCIKAKKPGIYALDSLDALSDDAELKRDMDDHATYGAAKAKQMSETFRRLTYKLEEANVLLIVVSQLRENIGAMFGEKYKRSGGKALDFYASIIVWVREEGKIKKTIDKVERTIGVDVHARVKKNKVGLPFRECHYPILFGYGIDDLSADINWLFEVGRDAVVRNELDMSKDGYKTRITNLRNKGGPAIALLRKQVRDVVFREWRDIEQGFLPKARKY